MSQSYAQISRQIEALQRQADSIKATEVAGVIGRIKEAIAVYQLSASDLGLDGDGGKAASQSSKSAGGVGSTHAVFPGQEAKGKSSIARFADDAGNTWVGRGPRPAWLRNALQSGSALEDFAVKANINKAGKAGAAPSKAKNAAKGQKVPAKYRD